MKYISSALELRTAKAADPTISHVRIRPPFRPPFRPDFHRSPLNPHSAVGNFRPFFNAFHPPTPVAVDEIDNFIKLFFNLKKKKKTFKKSNFQSSN